jgi:hypothetical protein
MGNFFSGQLYGLREQNASRANVPGGSELRSGIALPMFVVYFAGPALTLLLNGYDENKSNYPSGL